MERKEFIKSLIKDAIANDFEDFTTIESEVAGWAAERDVFASRQEIADSLLEW